MINTQSYSLEQGEKGINISFPKPPISITNRENKYILYFDNPVLIPRSQSVSVSYEPSGGSYIINGSADFIPKVFIKIKSLKKIQTKTLLRLNIKDSKNNILHSDYLLIVCSPNDTVSINGTLLPSNSIVGGIGPNGGSVLQISETSSARIVIVGSKVTGPSIAANLNVFVKSIITNNLIELDQIIPYIASSATGTYVFTTYYGCFDPNRSIDNDASSTYTALDYNNNWTYKIRDQIIAKFIPYVLDQSLVVLLPLKNTGILAPMSSLAPIPYVSIIKIGGRVNQDSIPVSEI
jgi:hypothetical protein